MKYVIIGGGIAGTTLAILLQRKGYEVVVAERHSGKASVGYGFMIHGEAIAVLNEIAGSGGPIPGLNEIAASGDAVPGESIRSFRLLRPDGVAVREEQLDSWSCMRRDQLMDFLNGRLSEGTLLQGLSFAGFIKDNGRIVAAQFEGGRCEEGDIFVGADGARSLVRQHLFGKTVYSPVRVK